MPAGTPGRGAGAATGICCSVRVGTSGSCVTASGNVAEGDAANWAATAAGSVAGELASVTVADGTWMDLPQPGHWDFRPAAWSLTLSLRPQPGQANEIMNTPQRLSGGPPMARSP